MGKAKVAKNIAYVLVPIFVVLLILATMGTAVIDEHVIITEDDYYVWKMAKGLTEITKEYTPAIIPVSITILIILASKSCLLKVSNIMFTSKEAFSTILDKS